MWKEDIGIDDAANMKKQKISYLVWKKYQRRAEVIASVLDANLEFMPHLHPSKFFRPLDYLLKFVATVRHILVHQPDVVIFQGPPVFSAISTLLMGVPYVIDAHNILIQGIWKKIPMTKFLMNKACAVVVHNSEILELAQKLFPSSNLVIIQDPLKLISRPNKQRFKNQILVICSFSIDEPVDIIIESICRLPDHNFVITAEVSKLQPLQTQRLRQCNNVNLTGFLPTQEYQDLLCSSLAALVLTTRDYTQPSGACEALSSNTQLIVSETSLTRKLFGEWAIFVDNSVDSIVCAIESLEVKTLDLSSYRNYWEISVTQGISTLYSFLPGSNMYKNPV